MPAAQSVNDLTGKVLCIRASDILKKLVSDRLPKDNVMPNNLKIITFEYIYGMNNKTNTSVFHYKHKS